MKVMHVKPREQKKNTEVGTHFLFHREGITLLSWWYHGLTVEDSGSHFSLSFSDHLSFLTSKNALLLLTSKLILIGWQKISHCRNSLQKTSVFVASVLKNKALLHYFVWFLRVVCKTFLEAIFFPTASQCLHRAGACRQGMAQSDLKQSG